MMLDEGAPPARVRRAIGVDEYDEVRCRRLGTLVLEIVRGASRRADKSETGQYPLQVVGDAVAVDRLDEQELDRLPIVLPGETLKGKPEIIPGFAAARFCSRSRSRSRQPVVLSRSWQCSHRSRRIS